MTKALFLDHAKPPANALLVRASRRLVLVFAHVIEAPDMKYSRYGTPGLALVFGLGVVVSLVTMARRWLDTGIAAALLAKLGQASLLIMFLHMAIQQTLDERLGVHDVWLRIAMALLLPTLLYPVLLRFNGSRRYLLGLAGNAGKVEVEKASTGSVRTGRGLT